MVPTHLFLINVTYTAVSSGATASACASIARVLGELPGGPRRIPVFYHGPLARSEQLASQAVDCTSQSLNRLRGIFSSGIVFMVSVLGLEGEELESFLCL